MAVAGPMMEPRAAEEVAQRAKEIMGVPVLRLGQVPSQAVVVVVVPVRSVRSARTVLVGQVEQGRQTIGPELRSVLVGAAVVVEKQPAAPPQVVVVLEDPAAPEQVQQARRTQAAGVVVVMPPRE